MDGYVVIVQVPGKSASAYLMRGVSLHLTNGGWVEGTPLEGLQGISWPIDVVQGIYKMEKG